MKSVNLISGGLDSFLCWFLFCKDAINVYVDIGHKYNTKELTAVKQLEKTIPNFNVKYHIGSDIGKFEDEVSGIIPNRNAELILSAAQYGEAIYFGVIKDEINSDKSLDFVRGMETVLNISNKKQYWTEGKVFNIKTPTREYNKSELIKMYIDSGAPLDYLYLTISCYDGDNGHCGRCPSRFKRYVAFKNNGLIFETSNNPIEWARETGIIEKCYDGTYNKSRATEIKEALI